MTEKLRILIAAGGTGGHVFPAIAIADAMCDIQPQTEFLFAGTRDRMEWKTVPAAGYDITPVWISGFHRRLTLKNLLFPLKLCVSLWQSRNLIRRFRPHAMISCGGFVAGPVGWIAARYKIPIFIQEQNSYPGVTNRKLARHATLIFTAFEEAGKWFSEEKTRLAGNPVRKKLIEQWDKPSFALKAKDHFRLDRQRPVLLVMGGSGGAKSINEAMLKHLETLLGPGDIQIIWQCGENYLEEVIRRIRKSAANAVAKSNSVMNDGQSVPEDLYPGLRLYGFLGDVAEAWAAADVVVSRAGATTCAELLAAGKAGILVPSPWVAGDHQTRNARSLETQGAAVVLEDEKLPDELPGVVRSLMTNRAKRESMQQQAKKLARTDAAHVIAKEILDQVNPESVTGISNSQKKSMMT